jgi:hypothetical protein
MKRLLANGRSALSRAVAAITIFSVLASLTSAAAFAAGGQVGNLRGGPFIDAKTKAPIADALVVATSPTGTYRAHTDARGLFNILGMNVDTYTVTISKQGYQPESFPGQTLIGDGTLDLGGPWQLSESLKTIAHVAARSVGGAFQPSQTIDSYTITSAQIQQTTGKAFSTNENALLLAVPGVTLTNAGTPTIRGGAAYEVGYEYNGVSFKEPFLGTNGSGVMNSMTSALFSGLSNVQVIEGAGDATNGNVGAGIINAIPARGSYPGTVNLDIEAGAPNFFHQFAGTWSWATPDDRFSDFMSFNGQRYAPYYGYHFTPLQATGNYFSNQYVANNQFSNNFVFKFGHNQNQSLEVLYTNIMQTQYGQAGPGGVYCNQTINSAYGLPACPAGTNPNALAYYPYDTLTTIGLPGAMGSLPWGLLPLIIGKEGSIPASLNAWDHLLPLTPGTPFAGCQSAITSGTGCVSVPGGQVNDSTNTRFLQFEYDYHMDPRTFARLMYYNWEQLNDTDGSYTSGGAWGTGLNQLGASWSNVGGPTVGMTGDITHQFTPNLSVELQAKEDVQHPVWDLQQPNYTSLSLGLPPLGAAISGLCSLPMSNGKPGTAPCPSLTDFFPGGWVCTHGINCSAGYSAVRMPTWGIGYNGTFFQNWGYGLRVVYDPGLKWHLDLGYRQEGQNQHWFNQLGQYGLSLPPNINPYDVLHQSWNASVLYPQVGQPRGAVSYELGRNDALRFGYGRSAVFADAQTGGTPFHLYGLQNFINIPAEPGSWCGWTATVVVKAGTSGCHSYAQQLYWAFDNLEAPDAGNGLPAIYTNYDFTYSHAFQNGFGLKVTPFEKIGTNLPTFFILNPVLGIFAVSNQGYNKTNGFELELTTPEHPLGFSGFVSATYQNVLSTTPPLTFAETTVPIVPNATLALGDLYRAGYVSPVSIRIGGTENFKDGFSLSPQLQYDIGYPYSWGNTLASQLANGAYANIPQVNFGPGITGGVTTLIGTAPGSSVSTNYVDPANPGTPLRPNIAWTRGTQGTTSTGGFLSHSNLFATTTFQWTHGRNTIGIQMQNLFGNGFINSVPAVNPWYQAVANGVSGPQTGFNTCVRQVGATRGCTAQLPRDIYAYNNGAYLLTNGNFTSGLGFAPLTPFNIDVFYQLKL